jgi:hypothetical protein
MIPITVELSCGGGSHPVVISLAFWGHVVAPSDPFSESLGAAFARMVPQECYEAYRQIVEALEACAPLMIERVLLQGRASHDSPDFQSYWQALLDACAHAEEVAAQLLQGTDDSVAYEWALAVAGSPADLSGLLGQQTAAKLGMGQSALAAASCCTGRPTLLEVSLERTAQNPRRTAGARVTGSISDGFGAITKRLCLGYPRTTAGSRRCQCTRSSRWTAVGQLARKACTTRVITAETVR